MDQRSPPQEQMYRPLPPLIAGPQTFIYITVTASSVYSNDVNKRDQLHIALIEDNS